MSMKKLTFKNFEIKANLKKTDKKNWIKKFKIF